MGSLERLGVRLEGSYWSRPVHTPQGHDHCGAFGNIVQRNGEHQYPRRLRSPNDVTGREIALALFTDAMRIGFFRYA